MGKITPVDWARRPARVRLGFLLLCAFAAAGLAPALAAARTATNIAGSVAPPSQSDLASFYLTQLAQATSAIILAVVLVSAYRTYRRKYLLDWAWSWWASCIYLCGSGL